MGGGGGRHNTTLLTSALDSNPNLLVPGYWSHAGLKLKQGTWTGWCIDCLGGLKCLLFQRIFFYLNGKGFNCPNTKTNNKIKTLFPHAVGNWPWMAANFFFFFYLEAVRVRSEREHPHPPAFCTCPRCAAAQAGREESQLSPSTQSELLCWELDEWGSEGTKLKKRRGMKSCWLTRWGVSTAAVPHNPPDCPLREITAAAAAAAGLPNTRSEARPPPSQQPPRAPAPTYTH